MTLTPFDCADVNRMILSYLNKFVYVPVETVPESWNGVYTKMTNGDTHCFFEPEPGVAVINGLGGAGMTLSFGSCEELIAKR